MAEKVKVSAEEQYEVAKQRLSETHTSVLEAIPEEVPVYCQQAAEKVRDGAHYAAETAAQGANAVYAKAPPKEEVEKFAENMYVKIKASLGAIFERMKLALAEARERLAAANEQMQKGASGVEKKTKANKK